MFICFSSLDKNGKVCGNINFVARGLLLCSEFTFSCLVSVTVADSNT